MPDPQSSPSPSANVDPAEIGKFNAQAQSWWDPRGAFRPLHDLNPLRLEYVQRGATLRGRAVLDVGCGGGILSESLCKAGAQVTAIDLAGEALEVAKLHALEAGLAIDYSLSSVEALAQSSPAAFDVITCMEMLEHVPDPSQSLGAMRALLKNSGSLFVSTLNRNFKSFALAIVGAEHVLRMLPRGTHEYRKFIRPSELARWGRALGLGLVDITGIAYNPLLQSFRLSSDADVNYLAHFKADEL
ncbi:MAG: bifunctional 2-polyprenyl-6-hydroxyphenol methylase/3-demethylubiquinol 3-O-methyltransferase UbiG [Proteobacteria bacterium]|nr:bifunctional 2-polyprenyl-6-hydroxyphenol methylase/3-demethylubiquinol 3-O-methyltransferase UbiG [Pseudomonadota bacterium]